MKYSININQLVLAGTQLDLIDAAILDYLCMICMSVNDSIESKRILLRTGKEEEWHSYTWIDYRHMLSEMPLMRIKSSGALTPRIQRIKDAGYIVTVRSANQKLYVRLTSKCDELFMNVNSLAKPFTKMNGAIHENERSRSPKRTDNNTNISLLDKSIETVYKRFIEKFKKNPNQYKLTEARIRKIKLRLRSDKDAGLEMLIKAIDNTAASPFHTGENERGWNADLDWIIRSYEQVEKLASMQSREQSEDEMKAKIMEEYSHGEVS